jgi:hypothetical protein
LVPENGKLYIQGKFVRLINRPWSPGSNDDRAR